MMLISVRGIPTSGSYFSEGSGHIHLSRLQCTSDDLRLTDCTADRSATEVCQHSEDAGVICVGMITPIMRFLQLYDNQLQVPLTALMVTSGWWEERMREKDEWRFATMEYGGQCVTTAGTMWMLVWSAQS